MWSAASIVVLFAVGGGLYAAWAAPAIAHGAPVWPYVLGVPAVYLAIVAFCVAWYFVLAWIFRARRPRDMRIGVVATLRLIWFEYWTLAGAAFRMLLYRMLVRNPAPASARLPILLVHGVLCNAGVWARAMRFLRGAGAGPVYAVSYGPPLASIDLFADQVHACIDQINAETGAPQIVVVTHSMGGLVMLAYLRRYGGARIRKLMTIAAPYRGSVHARLMFGTSLEQLRPGNPWLGELAPRAPAGGPPIVSIWSWHDSMVAPQTSSRLEGARNVELAGIGHNALLRDPQVFACVLEEYRQAQAAPPQGRGTAAPAATSEFPA
jgi:pimeloyl-ACP methyl ester carboxylesterase